LGFAVMVRDPGEVGSERVGEVCRSLNMSKKQVEVGPSPKPLSKGDFNHFYYFIRLLLEFTSQESVAVQ
jgi:hypothetical protein